MIEDTKSNTLDAICYMSSLLFDTGVAVRHYNVQMHMTRMSLGLKTALGELLGGLVWMQFFSKYYLISGSTLKRSTPSMLNNF